MPLLTVGVNHHTAPVLVRERLAVAPTALPGVLAGLRSLAAEGFLLSTCNRVEIYAFLDPATGDPERLVRFLAATGALEPDALAPHLYLHCDAAAVRHLFTVAAGLDSMVVGEDQILAQVKSALDAAQAARALGPILSRLGQTALATGKRVRAATAISRHHLSVVSVGLRLAVEQLGDLRRAVLIIGAGHTAELALKHLAGHHVDPNRASTTPSINIVNRTYERAARLAAHYAVQAIPWTALDDMLREVDLVISCTSAPEPVLAVPQVATALAFRQDATDGRALVLLDLAVPRDIEPAVATLSGVRLYNLDDLQAICAGNREHRLAETAQAEALVAGAVEQFLHWWQARAAVPTITALRAHADAIRAAEVTRALAHLPDLTSREAETVQYLAIALVNKLLHAPVQALQSAPDPAALAGAAQQLFGLPASPGSPGPFAENRPATVPAEIGAPDADVCWTPAIFDGAPQYS